MDVFLKKLEFLHKVLSVYILGDRHSGYFMSQWTGLFSFSLFLFSANLLTLLLYYYNFISRMFIFLKKFSCGFYKFCWTVVQLTRKVAAFLFEN